MLEWTRETLLYNLRFKLLSFFLAVAAWAYVQGDEVHDASLTARLAWSLPPQLVSADPLPSSVNLTVRGTRAATRRVKDDDIAIAIDVSGAGVGDQYLDLASLAAASMPPSVAMLSVSPSSIRFYLDEQTSRKVGVRPTKVGEPGDGYLVESVVVAPPVVEVLGPRSVVEGLRDVDTQPIDVSGLTEEANVEVRLDLPRTVRLAPNQIKPTATVAVLPRNESRVFTEVPVHVWGAHGWRPLEDQVSVVLEGPSALLRDLPPTEIAAFVHLPDNPDRDSYEAPFGPTEGLRLRVLHPGGDSVKVIKVAPSRVQVVR